MKPISPRHRLSGADTISELVRSSYTSQPSFSYSSYYGVPENYKEVKTLRDLLEIKYRYQPTKTQLRENIIYRIKSFDNPFQSIIGFDETVIPSVKRALLAGHDILFVGHIGQGKTKLSELISENLLSPIPIVDGTLTNDIPTEMPYNHLVNLINGKDVERNLPQFFVSKDCEEIIKNNGLDTKIRWIDGKQRYRYVLATPDISVKDLVGQIDVVKIIKKGIELYNIDSYSPGYLLQARYGILCLDELPVLDPRKQVTLLSVLQEGRFTTGAYPVFFKPDVKIIATANPMDYTHSGKIIEPLADRLKSHIETHYPNTINDETLILIQEMDMMGRTNAFLPAFMLKSLVRIFQKIRNHPDINTDRGVSVRSTIHSLEAVLGEVESSRSILYNLITIPRFSDLYCIFQSSKFELEEIEDTSENRIQFLNTIMKEVIQETTLNFFNGLFNSTELLSIKNEFRGKSFTVLQNQYQIFGKEKNTNFQNPKKNASSSLSKSKFPLVYTEQLKNFPMISKSLNKMVERLEIEQKELVSLAAKYNIQVNLKYLDFDKSMKKSKDNSSRSNEEELCAAIIEMFLEYLRFTSPPILEKRESHLESTFLEA
ncbi:MAG TPA: AAA family ATPase [Candidatus Nitrosocosmicus sp.]|nr:AAA family ATPase [Candidatus Nitrosocosmicus sp.]